MITIRLSAEPTSISASTIQMGECFILANEEAGDEVYMRIHDNVYNVCNSGIYIHGIPGKYTKLGDIFIICAQLETGWVFAFDKDEKVIPVSGIFRWRENDGIKS